MRILALISESFDDFPMGVLVTETPEMSAPVTVVGANQAMAELTGFQTAELIAHGPTILQGPRTNKLALKRMCHRLAAGKPGRIGVVNYRKNGTRYLCDIEAFPLQIKQKIVGCIAFEQEIAGRKGRFSPTERRPSVLDRFSPWPDLPASLVH